MGCTPSVSTKYEQAHLTPGYGVDEVANCDISVAIPLLLVWLLAWGKRELILVLFVRLFDLSLFGFVCFLFHLLSGMGCGL